MVVHINNTKSIFTHVFIQILAKDWLICIILQGICTSQSKLYISKHNITSGNEGEIDWHLNALDQKDPRLLKDLKDYYLSLPSDLHRKITNFRLQKKYIHGQFGQALVVDKYYSKSKYGGFFIEAGAYDGEAISNTLFLEIERNWTGLLVEGNPDSYKSLLSRNRNASSIETCLSRKTTPEVVNFDAASIFGGILVEGRPQPGEDIPVTGRTRIRPIVDATRRTIKMQCFPLFCLILALGNPAIDYLSLDIEGAELEVLRSLPFKKVNIQLISVEIKRKKMNEDAAGEHFDPFNDIVQLLDGHGYKLIKSIQHTKEALAFEVFFHKDSTMTV